MVDMHNGFNVSISTENIFIQKAIIYALEDMFFISPPIVFTTNDNNYTDKDVIFYEVSPGELYICNDRLLNRKQHSLLYVIHNSGPIDNDNEISKCFRDAIFIDIKAQNINKITTTLKLKLCNHTNNPYELSWQKPPQRNHDLNITETQLKIASYLLNGLDLMQISRKKKITLRTTKHHIKEIMRKFHLQNGNELYKFIYLLKKRGYIVQEK